MPRPRLGGRRDRVHVRTQPDGADVDGDPVGQSHRLLCHESLHRHGFDELRGAEVVEEGREGEADALEAGGQPVLRELRPGHQVACHFPVEKIEGSIVGPRPEDVAPVMPDHVERAQTLGTNKELGGEMYGTNVKPSHTNDVDRH